MYCPHCGKEVIEGAAFCAHCGKAVAPTTSADQGPQYTLTFERHDQDGPPLTITMSTGDSTVLVDRDSQSISLPGGTYKFTLDTETQHEEQEISLDTDTRVNLCWASAENHFLATVDTQLIPAGEETASAAEARSTETPSGVCCPHCGSHNVQYAPVTTVNNSGYSCCTGCCGGLLLGPLGLLLGLCGIKSQATTTTSWMCNNCGRSFVTPDQAARSCKTCAGIGTWLNVMGLLILGPLFFHPVGWLAGGLLLICGCLSLYIAFKPERTGYSGEELIPDFDAWKKKYMIIHAVAAVIAVLLAISVGASIR